MSTGRNLTSRRRFTAVRVAGSLSLIVGLGSAALRVIAQPATGTAIAPAALPATAPSTIPSIDPDSPRGALMQWADAIDKPDADKLRALTLLEGPEEQRLFDALVARAVALARFRAALVGQFGNAAAIQLVGDPIAHRDSGMRELAMSSETITGDAAVVGTAPAQRKLRRVNGKWMIALGEESTPPAEPGNEAARAARAANISDAARVTQVYAALFSEAADEVAAKQYRTIDDAGVAVQAKLMTAMERLTSEAAAASKTPATLPATAPATAPSDTR